MPMHALLSPVVLTYNVMTCLPLLLSLGASHVRNVLKELRPLSLLDDVKVVECRSNFFHYIIIYDDIML